MKQPPVFIKKIYQKSNFTFVIEWNDGIQTDYLLGTVQKRCPCAQCSHDRISKGKDVDGVKTDLRAVRLSSVGRYALKIQFSSGCSNGIYSFALLRSMFEEKINV